MATEPIFVVITNGYATGAGPVGGRDNPWDWDRFISELEYSQINESYPVGDFRDIIFYLSGTRSTSASGQVIAISANSNTRDSNTVTYTFSGWDGEPYRIYGPNAIRWDTKFISDLRIHDMMLTLPTTNFIFAPLDVDQQRRGTVYFDNCHIAAGGTFYFSQFQEVQFVNCNIKANGFTVVNDFRFYNVGGVDIKNSIMDVSDIWATVPDVGFVSLYNVALTSAVSDYTAYQEGLVTYETIQENWPSATAFGLDAPDLVQSALNYVNDDFGNISAVDGDTTYTSKWWDDTTRDGIGALYFPTISGVGISASSAIGGFPITSDFVFSGNDPFTVFSATEATYSFGEDFTTSSVSANDVITKEFSGYGRWDVDATITSFNQWYTTATDTFVISAYNLSGSSVTFDFRNIWTSATITSANIYDTILLSANVAPPEYGFQYLWDFGDGTSVETFSESTTTHFWETSGTKTVVLTVWNNFGDVSASDTNTFSVSAIIQILYVNINSSYTCAAPNSGTISDPLNYNEFVGRLETSGTFGDIYRLQGSRVLTKPTGASTPWYPISADPNMNFQIEAWDMSAYGPWVLIPEDYATSDNTRLSLAGTVLRNGIIYNKTFGWPTRYGGQIYVSNLYDVYVVCQGEGSYITLVPSPSGTTRRDGQVSEVDLSGVNIIGSTLYTTSGYYDEATDAHTVSLIDSVFRNLQNVSANDETLSGSFSAADVVILYCAVSNASSDVAGDFNITSASSVQYNWTPPTDYPFTPDNDLYNKDIAYILIKKSQLRPFDGIGFPPNPGYNFSAYPGYDTGLFGEDRASYSGDL